MWIKIAFWVLLFLMFYTYIFYPVLISIISSFISKSKEKNFTKPYVSILMSVYNEEEFIKRKIESILKSNYPKEKIELIIGSDCSDDKTNKIIGELAKEEPSILLINYNKRQGKIKTINDLVSKASGEVLILTDAKAIFNTETISKLIEGFTSEDVAIVGANIQSKERSEFGSGKQETFYMNFENRIKYYEGNIFGGVMGVFGACYAIRKTDFEKVPENFLVDDFYITIKSLKRKKKVIYSKLAFVHENVTPSISEEYRRKKRIATGNFQNLFRLWPTLLNPFSKIGFLFVSHKLIRWFGFLILPLLFVFNLFLIEQGVIYLYSICFQAAFYMMPLIDKCMRIFKIQIIPLRFVTHFVLMNIAMLNGFIIFLKGVKTNVWEPTKRE